MSEIHKMKDYKFAKVVVKDLEMVLKIVDLSIRGLTQYKIYIPVQALLSTLTEQKAILESHHQKYSKMKKEKGKINE